MEIKIIDKTNSGVQFVKEETKKTQIVLHHTVSETGTVNFWAQNPERIATAFMVCRNGDILQIFDEKYWAYHIGCRESHFAKFGLPYSLLDKNTIGIEIESWGPLCPYKDKMYPILGGKELKPNLKCKSVQYFYEYCSTQKYRGYQYYERYTTAELQALQELLPYLQDKHSIPANYTSQIWNFNALALKGEKGIFPHTSYRPDKSDIHPQPEIINILKSLK